MVRFIFTLNMGSYKGRIVHQVVGDVDVADIGQLCETLNDTDFIVVDQYYNVNDEDSTSQDWKYKGHLVLNTSNIGKVQQYVDAPARAPFKR